MVRSSVSFVAATATSHGLMHDSVRLKQPLAKSSCPSARDGIIRAAISNVCGRPGAQQVALPQRYLGNNVTGDGKALGRLWFMSGAA